MTTPHAPRWSIIWYCLISCISNRCFMSYGGHHPHPLMIRIYVFKNRAINGIIIKQVEKHLLVCINFLAKQVIRGHPHQQNHQKKSWLHQLQQQRKWNNIIIYRANKINIKIDNYTDKTFTAMYRLKSPCARIRGNFQCYVLSDLHWYVLRLFISSILCKKPRQKRGKKLTNHVRMPWVSKNTIQEFCPQERK